ncbi:MAG: mercury methylation ferredoxin HgcB [Desulfitobacterium hafniense]|nr:mercury methylation ferredoxin HgcB [Desulfitobacterium hafniense]
MKNRYLKNVSTLKLKTDKCTGCGKCIEVCPHNVFVLNDGKTHIVDKDRCMECGACVKNCPFNAIEVKPGVGCAYAIIMGWLTGTEPSCDCSDNSSGGCC